jgi:dipeptidyl aminopeptidase/acylaminoacyl peptidase
MKNFLKLSLLFLIACSFAPNVVVAQDTLPVLQKKDYDQWQYLNQTKISPDGKWISYSISVVDGNDTLFLKSMKDTTHYEFAFGGNLNFSRDSKWAAVRIGVSEKEKEKMKEKKKPVHYKMKLVNLSSGDVEDFKDIRSYSFSRNSGHLAMRTYPPEKSKLKGSDLILRNLKTGVTRNIGNVKDWSFNKPGDRLAYIIDAKNKLGNGVELLNLEDYNVSILISDTTTFKNLSWEKEGKALAVMQAFYDTSYVKPSYKILAWQDVYKPETKFVFDPSKIADFPDTLRVKDSFKPVWSKDLTTVFIGINDWTKKEKKKKKDDKDKKSKDKKDKKEKKPGVDVWHWKDDPIQPRQQKSYGRDNNYTYLCSWDLKNNRFIRLASPDLKDGRLTGDQKYAYMWDETPYQPQFKLVYADHYLVNTQTGEKKEILKNYIKTISPSPGGKYLLYFKDNHWWIYDIYGDKHTNLTEKLDVPFWNIRDDHPAKIKPAFGYGGWFKDDKKVLLYDEYDVWETDPSGKKARRLTQGREDETIYRVQRLDYEEPYLDPDQPVYLRAFGDKTKKSGFAKITPKGKFVSLLFEDSSNSRLQKAKKADNFIYVSQTYEKSPALYLTNTVFTKNIQVVETNPQQKNYKWGKAELMSFKNRDGKELQGTLIYPANYESGKKYPMLVYIYEILSNGLHRYIVPSPKSFYNFTNYSQQGYFILQPDIVYKTNHPGESAVDCVVPAVEEMIKTGMIDEKKIGIMGHSWGAYQTSFIITQTKLFSAAVAGAPLTNMISMYNSIYWNSGTPDQQIFETSQGRLQQPYWDIMEEYINNSPIFQAKNIETPILVTFGDKDGAVDWHQGIEFYITMRRMQKPMIMLVYADENHAVRKKENALDYTRKINEFFDYYLLGKQAKPWINDGVTYLDKQKERKKK